ncbi:MAG TPA: SURF1 family protein [Devosiaceae bacterium]|jgi:surfeit locus 1 family protein|nr:SURF1 family protein [Devosiaceae bacterium]
MTDRQPQAAAPRRRWWNLLFIVLMLGLTVIFLWLGNWQLQRLDEKQALIATVAARMDSAPLRLPPVAEWDFVGWERYDYQPVTLTGSFRHDSTVLVFTSLSAPNGRHSGPGYWVMAPFELDAGGFVFLNRGFVPQSSRAAFVDGGAAPTGRLTLTGIARLSEEAGSFTPDTDSTRRMDWVRDVERLALQSDADLTPLAPVFVDLPAGDEGALPQGGETVLTFTDNHLGYAITWFGFALITPLLLLVWLLAQRRARKVP